MSLSLFNPILFFIFSLPLFFYLYNIRSPFELPKLTYSIVYVLILLVFHCLEQVKKKQLQIKYNNYFKLYTFFILANIASYFFSTNPYISFWGDSHLPADSLISTLIFYVFSFLILQYADDEAKINKIMKVFIITAFIQVLYGVIQRLKLDPMPWAEAQTVFGTQGLTVSYACLIGCLNPFVISQIYRSKKNIETLFLFFLIAIINYILLCTGSRTPIVVNWASSLFISLFYLYHHKKFKPGYKFCVLLLTIGLTVFSFKFINSNSEIEQKSHSFLLNKGFETRKVLFLSGFEAWKKRPILGYGPETYMFAQKPYQSIELNQFESWNSIWVKAHNSFIHFLVSIGLLGFLSFLSLYFYTAYKSLKIFFTKEPTEHQAVAFTIFTGYQFLFFANLTGFNLITTQMLYAILPVLFSLYDETGGQLKNFKFYNLKLIKTGSAILILVSLFTIYKSINYWYADILYQKSEFQSDTDNDNIGAVESLNAAIEKNPDEPNYYCGLAKVYSLMLFNNKKTLSDDIKAKALTEIDNDAKICRELGLNNHKMMFNIGTIYSDLFFNQVTPDASKALKVFEELRPILKVNPWVYLNIGTINLQLGNVDIFKENMSIALDCKADYMPAYIELFTYYYKNNATEDINRLLEKFQTVTFYSYEFVSYINHLVTLAHKFNDAHAEKIFKDKLDQYSYLKNADPI